MTILFDDKNKRIKSQHNRQNFTDQQKDNSRHAAEHAGQGGKPVERNMHADEIPDEIELFGVCTDICVISNAMLLKAFFPEAEIIVDSSCCAGVSPETHKNALEAMKICQITVIWKEIIW